LIGDQQAKTWSIGVCWRALEILLYHEELKDLHHLYCIKSSQFYYNVYILYPLFLLAVTYSQPLYIESYLPLCMCRFCSVAWVCICCASYLLYFK
jgi:hypothetical protein